MPVPVDALSMAGASPPGRWVDLQMTNIMAIFDARYYFGEEASALPRFCRLSLDDAPAKPAASARV